MSNAVRKTRRCNGRIPDGLGSHNNPCRIMPFIGEARYPSHLAEQSRYHRFDQPMTDNASSSPPHNPNIVNEEILDILKMLSHDLRGPLTSIGAGLKLLKKGAYGNIDRTVSNEIGELFIMVEGLMGTLEDFLGRAFSINSGLEVYQERLHLSRDIFQPVMLELSKDIRSRAIAVEEHLRHFPGTQPVIVGDRFWLKAIFRNLIRNAIKYGGNGCRIRIGFTECRFHYRMNVFNTGKPVPEEFRDRLFTKFGRISRKDTRNSDGMGLGLFLVKHIIQQHGGNIWYEAAENGSNFILSLPKRPPPSFQPAESHRLE